MENTANESRASAMTLREMQATLAAAGIGNAEGEALLLASHLTGRTVTALRADPDAAISHPLLGSCLARRAAREPLQYILGIWDFCSERYEITPGCLIPRAETELLVERAAALLPAGGTFCDLCTGSGCIAVSLAAARPDAHGIGIDAYETPLALSRKNALRNGVADRVVFRRGDVQNDVFAPGEQYDLILSNPPYVTEDEYRTLEKELYAEPREALVGTDTDGGGFYRAILRYAARHLAPNGVILFEIGSGQRAMICEAARNASMTATVFPDYSGLDRVALLRQNTEDLL